MPLDDDAQAVADAFSHVLQHSLHTLGVDGAREFTARMSQENPPVPSGQDIADRLLPGPRGDIPVRVYRPGPQGGLPVLIYFHGGGWTIGSLDSADALCRDLSVRANCVVVSVDYRLAPENKFPVPVDDCYAALEWVAGNAASLNADTSRIAVAGDSAGANLCAAICLISRDRDGPRIALQVLAYPATEYAVQRESWKENAAGPMITVDDIVWFWGQYLRDEGDRTDPRATPSNAETHSGLPPAFVLTAEYDPLRDDGEAYAGLLVDGGVKTSVKRYPGVFHGFLTLNILTRYTEAVDDIVGHLRAAFEPPKGSSVS